MPSTQAKARSRINTRGMQGQSQGNFAASEDFPKQPSHYLNQVPVGGHSAEQIQPLNNEVNDSMNLVQHQQMQEESKEAPQMSASQSAAAQDN